MRCQRRLCVQKKVRDRGDAFTWHARRVCCRNGSASAIPLAADELLDAAISFVVGHLHGRMLGTISGGGMQHASDSAIKSKFAAANRINTHSGRVWRILDRELYDDSHLNIVKDQT